jgi:two-component system LytT family response regulator
MRGRFVRAVEKILALSPDIVFLDVQMPGMDGFDVLRAVPKENLPGVIFLTTYDRLEDWLSSGWT